MPGTKKTPPNAKARTETKPWCRTLGTVAADGELRGNLRSFTRRMLQRVARSNWGGHIDSAYRYGDKVLEIRVQARRFRPGWGLRSFYRRGTADDYRRAGIDCTLCRRRHLMSASDPWRTLPAADTGDGVSRRPQIR